MQAARRQTIDEAWREIPNDDRVIDNWQKLIQRSNKTKVALADWNRRTFRKADKEIEKLEREIQDIQNEGNKDWEKVKTLQDRIKDLWKQEETYWNQRSRIKWLRCGDHNTKFFHTSTIQRRERNRIERLRNDQGEWVEGQANINKAALVFF